MAVHCLKVLVVITTTGIVIFTLRKLVDATAKVYSKVRLRECNFLGDVNMIIDEFQQTLPPYYYIHIPPTTLPLTLF